VLAGWGAAEPVLEDPMRVVFRRKQPEYGGSVVMHDRLVELSASDCEALLRRNTTGHLAMVDGEAPYMVPISFVFADNAIYGHTSPGKKLDLLRRSPQVAFLVDEIRNLATWQSVLVEGRWEELTAPADLYRARSLILDAFEGPWRATAGHGHRTTIFNAIFYRIRIERVSDRGQNP